MILLSPLFSRGQTCASITTNDTTISLPVSSIQLKSCATSGFKSFQWVQTGGVIATIATPAAANTIVSGLQVGFYLFSFVAIASTGQVYSDQVQIQVNSASPVCPVCPKCPTIPKYMVRSVITRTDTYSDSSVASKILQ